MANKKTKEKRKNIVRVTKDGKGNSRDCYIGYMRIRNRMAEAKADCKVCKASHIHFFIESCVKQRASKISLQVMIKGIFLEECKKHSSNKVYFQFKVFSKADKKLELTLLTRC